MVFVDLKIIFQFALLVYENAKVEMAGLAEVLQKDPTV